MFVPCPHCQFLVAHHPQLRPLPADCPRCGKPLQEDIDPDAGGGEGTGIGQSADSDPSIDSAAPATGDVATDDPAVDTLAVDEPAAVSTDRDDPDLEGGIDTDAAAAGESNDGNQSNNAVDAIAAMPAASTATFAARAPKRGWTRWRWPLIALLALLLVLQILVADRARLAADPRWRPLVETLCGALGCSLPPWHEPASFTMLDRKVRPDPQQAGALRVDATFRNDARWSQAWPALQLALSDADGRVIGSRVFQPADYLGAAPGTLLSPGQSAQITFLVQEPSPGTVAFLFEFR